MATKRVIFMGSKPIGYQCFRHLLSVQNELDFKVTGLLTQPRKEFGAGNDLTELATIHHIPVFNSPDDMPDCDIIYSVQYHIILQADHIAKASQCAVNLHMAPLPEYRGSNQFSFAIIDDKKEFGTTIHLMDTRIDHGDILFQKRFAIPKECWVKELYDMTFDASLQLFKERLADIVHNNYTATPQAAFESRYGTSLHFRNEAAIIKLIDLNWDKGKIERHVRATSMPGFEPPYCLVNGEKLYFTRAEHEA